MLHDSFLHCLVFREQSVLLNRRFISDLFIISRCLFPVKKFFWELFELFCPFRSFASFQPVRRFPCPSAIQGSGLRRCITAQRLVLYYRIFLGLSIPFLTFFTINYIIRENFSKSWCLYNKWNRRKEKAYRQCNMLSFADWWRRRDLNSWHCGYEPHALANWATPPVVGRDGFEPS